MPLHKEILEEHYQVYFWKITESEEELLVLALLSDSEKEKLTKLRATNKRLQWLACRVLINELFEEKVLIKNNDQGKPSINVESLNITLPHSGNYVLLGISENEIGVDIEQIKDKVLKITSRFMSKDELTSYKKDETAELAMIYWSAKESLIKIYGKKDLELRSEIQVYDIDSSNNLALGTFRDQKSKKPYNIRYDNLDDYIFVIATEQK